MSVPAIRVVHLAQSGDLPAAARDIADGDGAVLLQWPGAIVSPFASRYLEAAMAASASDDRIAGVTLGLARFRPGGEAPFVPIEDGGDVVYLRPDPAPALLFTPAQARRFADRGAGSLVEYLTATEGYLIAPRTPLAHDGGPARGPARMLPVGVRDWRVPPLSAALAVYDARYELSPDAAARLVPELAGLDVAIDLWAQGEKETSTLLLSSRPCTNPIRRWSLDLTPPEANLALSAGEGIFSLGAREDFGPADKMCHTVMVRHATRFSSLRDYAAQFAAPLKRLVPGGRRG